MEKVGFSKLDVIQTPLIQHAFGVVQDGCQIDPNYFVAPCGEAGQKEARSCSGVEGSITRARWHQTKRDIDPFTKEPARQEISFEIGLGTTRPIFRC